MRVHRTSSSPVVTVTSRLVGLTTTVCGCCVVIACSRACRNVAENPATSARMRTVSVLRPIVGADESHRDRDDQQGDDQLEEGEAPSIYFWLLSHEVMSAFSPSPPGAPSLPSDQRSYSPLWPGQQRYLYALPHGSLGTAFLR